jgi:hypothetical protein
MDYKGIEYTVVQTSHPRGWKWTAYFDPTRSRSGDAFSKVRAISDAEKAIDRALKRLSGNDALPAP